jgi:uncharacterized protein YndB with AHSA1/START domain
MVTNDKTKIQKDLKNKQLKLTREFDADVETVWKAWTTREILDKWWAPKPWRAETKSMDFREGGSWLYAMVGPEGEKHWARADYKSIKPKQSFEYIDAFCDENGKITNTAPSMHWNCDFKGSGDATVVQIDISFDKEADIQAILEMGFEQGFTDGLANLDELLEKKLV